MSIILDKLEEACHINTRRLIDLDAVLKEEYFIWLLQAVEYLYSVGNVQPSLDDLFKVFSYDWTLANVVIIAQDPYYTPNIADGLAFSTKDNYLAPSINVIFKELERTYNKRRTNTNLEDWADQGVILINTSLTVEDYKPNSHSELMWDYFVRHCINKLLELNPNLIILAWGKHAKDFAEQLNITDNSTVLQSVHPVVDARSVGVNNSRKFVGNNHFVVVNDLLDLYGKPQINWVGEERVDSLYHCLYKRTSLTIQESKKYDGIYDMEIEYVE